MDERRTGYESGRTKKKRRKKKKNNNKILIAALVLIIIGMVAFGSIFLWKYGPTKERYDLDTYFGIKSDNGLGITVNNEVMEQQGLRIDNHIYVPYEIVRDYLNERFYWDSNENLLLYTLPEAIVKAEVGSSTYTVAKTEQSKDYAILKTEGSAAYIALDFVKEYTDLDYN